MLKLVIFDIDDTLCLTEEATFKMENEAAVSIGFPPMTREAHQKNWGVALKDAIVDRIPGIDVEAFIQRQEILLEKYHAQGLLDSIPKENLDAIEKLKIAGKKLAVLTNRTTAEARHLMHEDHPLSKTIEKFYHKDNSEFLKPDPRAFDQILKDFNVKPNECVYVGDSISDAKAANGIGIPFIAVLESGLRSKEDFREFKVDFFAFKFPDILTHILKN